MNALPEYRAAFAEYGLRHGSTGPAEAAARLRRLPAEVHGPVVMALNSWLLVARLHKAPEAAWLERVLAEADLEGWRLRLRAAWAVRKLQPVEALAREVDVVAQPPQLLADVAHILQGSDRIKEAVRLLRRAQETYPGDFWINHSLGVALAEIQPPQPHESIRFLTVSVALRPESAGA